MTERLISSRALFGAGFAFVVIGATSYFAYAALQGDSGLVEQVRLAREETDLGRQLETLRARRGEMETLTRRLSEEHLDLDLLDERARAVLGHVRPEDVVIR